MMLEFPEFLPDLPAFNNPGMTIVKNVVPCGASYEAFPALVEYSTALTAYARGAYAAKNPDDGVSFNFAGDATKLYALGLTTSGTYDDVSKAGGYSLASDEKWSFSQFGARVIAVNINTPSQSFVMGTSTLFADLGGSPPQARYVDAVKDFVVMGNTYDASDGFVPYRVRWSGIGNSTSWAVSATTQADYQDLQSRYGWVNQVVGGDYGVIFQEKAITRMDYVGSPTIFQFETVEVNQGTRYPKSVISVGNLIFFIGLDGFRVFDGHQSIAIGFGKVDKFFSNDLDASNSHMISSAVDFKNTLVMWAYPSSALGQGTVNSRILLYNYSPNATKRWSYVDINTELIYSALSEGYTLDQLDNWQATVQTPHVIPGNIDLLPYSLDSRVWIGDTVLYGAFSANHKLSFSSTNTFLSAVLETAEAQLTDGWRSDLFKSQPMIDGAATVTAQIGTRNLQSESVTWGSAITLDSDGEINSRSNARYHRLRINTSGAFNHAIGVEITEFKKSGDR